MQRSQPRVGKSARYSRGLTAWTAALPDCAKTGAPAKLKAKVDAKTSDAVLRVMRVRGALRTSEWSNMGGVLFRVWLLLEARRCGCFRPIRRLVCRTRGGGLGNKMSQIAFD